MDNQDDKPSTRIIHADNNQLIKKRQFSISRVQVQLNNFRLGNTGFVGQCV